MDPNKDSKEFEQQRRAKAKQDEQIRLALTLKEILERNNSDIPWDDVFFGSPGKNKAPSLPTSLRGVGSSADVTDKIVRNIITCEEDVMWTSVARVIRNISDKESFVAFFEVYESITPEKIEKFEEIYKVIQAIKKAKKEKAAKGKEQNKT